MTAQDVAEEGRESDYQCDGSSHLKKAWEVDGRHSPRDLVENQLNRTYSDLEPADLESHMNLSRVQSPTSILFG